MRQAPLPERPRVRKLHETMFEFLRADGPGRRECVGTSIFPRPEERAVVPSRRAVVPWIREGKNGLADVVSFRNDDRPSRSDALEKKRERKNGRADDRPFHRAVVPLDRPARPVERAVLWLRLEVLPPRPAKKNGLAAHRPSRLAVRPARRAHLSSTLALRAPSSAARESEPAVLSQWEPEPLGDVGVPPSGRHTP